jgi:hypothetical protein
MISQPTIRRTAAAAALVAAVLACSLVARAGVQMSTGIRYVIPNASPAECGTKAQAALAPYLENAAESPAGSGDWIASGPTGSVHTTASATVNCSPVGKGYVVTFTCAVQVPENPYTADALCMDIAHNFSGKAVTALATAAPAPSGCTTTNLAGTWTSNGSGPTLTMDATGGLTDQDGVSGNWGVYNGNVTLTYYGTHTLTISSDAKHLTGGGYNLSRKC